MGIPKFYKWLVKRYPLVVAPYESEKDMPPVGRKMGLILDNLYIDMNGLVHNVTHANHQNRLEKTSELMRDPNRREELWAMIFSYIDDIVHTVNPR